MGKFYDIRIIDMHVCTNKNVILYYDKQSDFFFIRILSVYKHLWFHYKTSCVRSHHTTFFKDTWICFFLTLVSIRKKIKTKQIIYGIYSP